MVLVGCEVKKGIKNKPSEMLFLQTRLGRTQKIYYNQLQQSIFKL